MFRITTGAAGGRVDSRRRARRSYPAVSGTERVHEHPPPGQQGPDGPPGGCGPAISGHHRDPDAEAPRPESPEDHLVPCAARRRLRHLELVRRLGRQPARSEYLHRQDGRRSAQRFSVRRAPQGVRAQVVQPRPGRVDRDGSMANPDAAASDDERQMPRPEGHQLRTRASVRLSSAATAAGAATARRQDDRDLGVEGSDRRQ